MNTWICNCGLRVETITMSMKVDVVLTADVMTTLLREMLHIMTGSET